MTGALDVVRWTARSSALLFSVALAAPALVRAARQRQFELFLVFVLAHTMHFAAVVWYALTVPGAALFPAGKTLDASGGWPRVFGIFAVFYATAALALAARRVHAVAARTLSVAGSIATSFIAFMFLATYVPLIARSLGYAAPAAAVAASTLADWLTRRR